MGQYGQRQIRPIVLRRNGLKQKFNWEINHTPPQKTRRNNQCPGIAKKFSMADIEMDKKEALIKNFRQVW